jgi:hypothetical protein
MEIKERSYYCRDRHYLIPSEFIKYWYPEYEGGDQLVHHVRLGVTLSKYGISKEEYCSCFILGRGLNNLPKCRVCGNDLYLHNGKVSHGFVTFCSYKCTNSDQERCNNLQRIRKEYSSSPEYRRMQRDIKNLHYKHHPEIISNISRSVSNYYSENPEAADKLVNSIRNGFRQGFYESKYGKLFYASSYELEFIKQMEFKDDVTFNRSDLRIPYMRGGIERRYFPDFDITYLDGHREIIEIKPQKFINDEVNQLKFSAAREYVKGLPNTTFRIITEIELGI